MTTSQLTQEAVKLLARLIETPRLSRQEKDAADLLEKHMKEECRLKVNRHGNNLWCMSWDEPGGNPKETRTLLLNAHIDTVKPATTWTREPFKATIEGECIYGLGSNDDGASLVSLLQVYRTLCREKLPYNLIFLASAEEEVSGRNGIESVLPLLPKVDVALVGEPTGMQPAIAEKGLMVIDATATGKSGHAARDEGDNAIYHAIDDINWIRNNTLPLHTDLLGPVKMTATIIAAGSQHNVIPDACTFTIDVRSNECYTNEEIFDILGKNLGSRLQARSFRLSSSRIDMKHPLVRMAVKHGRSPFGSPTLSDQALMRFPSMKMGPGQSCRSHTADEFIKTSEIQEAIDLYLAILRELNL